MSANKQQEDQEVVRLQDKPQRRSGGRLPLLLLILGGVVLLGGARLLIWQIGAHQAPATSSNAPAATATTESGKTGPGDPPIYWQTIQEQVAQGLHLTVAEVKTKLQSGEPIGTIAAEQNISTDQLRTIELNAIQKGHDVLVSMGYLTQQQSDQGMQDIRSWDQRTLDQHITEWYLDH